MSRIMSADNIIIKSHEIAINMRASALVIIFYL